jgi:transposase
VLDERSVLVVTSADAADRAVFSILPWVARVDDRRVISGIIFVIRNGLRWRDAPKDYGRHKTIYNRFIRWSRLGVFNRIFAQLASKGGKPDRLMIDATPLKAHCTAACSKWALPRYRAYEGRPELQAAAAACTPKAKVTHSNRVL